MEPKWIHYAWHNFLIGSVLVALAGTPWILFWIGGFTLQMGLGITICAAGIPLLALVNTEVSWARRKARFEKIKNSVDNWIGRA